MDPYGLSTTLDSMRSTVFIPDDVVDPTLETERPNGIDGIRPRNDSSGTTVEVDLVPIPDGSRNELYEHLPWDRSRLSCACCLPSPGKTQGR